MEFNIQVYTRKTTKTPNIRNKHHIHEVKTTNLTFILVFLIVLFCIFHEYWHKEIKAPSIQSLKYKLKQLAVIFLHYQFLEFIDMKFGSNSPKNKF